MPSPDHRQLGSGQRQHLDRSGRRRVRADIQNWLAADKRLAPELLQRRGTRRFWSGVVHSIDGAVPVPSMKQLVKRLDYRTLSEPIEACLAFLENRSLEHALAAG